MQLLNNGELSRSEFKERRDQLLAAATPDPSIARVRPGGLEDVPTLQIRIDDEKVGALGIAQADVDRTLSAAWGGVYVNDFVDRGRVKRVFVQGAAAFRGAAEDLDGWHVRTASGDMAPFSAFATVDWAQAPTTLTRFSGLPSYEIQGQAAPGFSSGQAMERMTALAAPLRAKQGKIRIGLRQQRKGASCAASGMILFRFVRNRDGSTRNSCANKVLSVSKSPYLEAGSTSRTHA